MLIVRLRNLLLHWLDPVVGASLYIDPTGQVYPAGINSRDESATTNSSGEARIGIAGLSPGDHTLWIVPELSTTDPVDYWTATGPDIARIFRGMRIQFTTNSQKKVMSATMHASTRGNGTLAVQVGSGKDQVLDVRLQPTWIKSPYNYERKQDIDMIVVHKTGGEVIGPAINQFLSGKTSAHYIVDRDGQIVKMVLEGRAAGHASNENAQDQSHWGTQTKLAWRSIGIENVGSTKQGLTDAQYTSLIRLIQDLMRRLGIARHRVVAHSDILTDGKGSLSDDRIACPGHQFEWSQLEDATPPIGLARTGGNGDGKDPVADFFEMMNRGLSLSGGKPLTLRPGDFDPQTVNGKLQPGKFDGTVYKETPEAPIKQLQTWLTEIGYSVGPTNGQYNPRFARAVRHFQTHFEGRSTNDTINENTAALIRAVRVANPKAD